jgi:hypothetical protein
MRSNPGRIERVADLRGVHRQCPPMLPRVAMLRMNTPSSPDRSCMRTRSPSSAPARERARGIDRDDADGESATAVLERQLRHERALARRAGKGQQYVTERKKQLRIAPKTPKPQNFLYGLRESKLKIKSICLLLI